MYTFISVEKMLLKVLVLAFVVIFSGSASLFLSHVIRSYFKKKPLGLQTILGKVIILFTQISDIAGTAMLSCVFAVEVFGPIENDSNNFICYLKMALAYTTTLSYYACCSIVIIVKYLSIYHRSAFIVLDIYLFLKKYLEIIHSYLARGWQKSMRRQCLRPLN